MLVCDAGTILNNLAWTFFCKVCYAGNYCYTREISRLNRKLNFQLHHRKHPTIIEIFYLKTWHHLLACLYITIIGYLIMLRIASDSDKPLVIIPYIRISHIMVLNLYINIQNGNQHCHKNISWRKSKRATTNFAVTLDQSRQALGRCYSNIFFVSFRC